MKIAFMETPTDMPPNSSFWTDMLELAVASNVDALLLNEMPVGKWLAGNRTFDERIAAGSIADHEQLLNLFGNAPVKLLSSRPIKSSGKLVNTAFIYNKGQYRDAHQKFHLPSEKGFFETEWFERGNGSFLPITVNAVSFGFLICTELMFTEHARQYAKEGAQVILVPRATGGNIENWKTAASMAAIVSGCYVLSSNRSGISETGVSFNGTGFAFGPDGRLISETTSEKPIAAVTIDTDFVLYQKKQYPCYITLA